MIDMFESCRQYRSQFPLTPAQEALCDLLERNSYVTPTQYAQLRDFSLSFFGVPTLYSIKANKASDRGALRVIYEPGGRDSAVSCQIDGCLILLNEMSQLLNWPPEAAQDVNRMARVVFPPKAEQTANWEGGIWLGLDSADNPPMIKVYASLRNYPALRGWQKLADIFGEFADSGMAPVLSDLISQAGKLGNPVGVCFGFDCQGIRGIRFYSDVTHPDAEGLKRLCATYFPNSVFTVEQLCRRFAEQFGAFGDNSITLGFDFAAADGVMIPELLRFKLELSCCLFSTNEQRLLPEWLDQTAAELALSTEGFFQKVQIARQFLGDVYFHYLSLGVQNSTSHLTLYYEPFCQLGKQLYKLGRATERVQSFLCGSMTREGYWQEFMLVPGASDEWVTAYVALCLLNSRQTPQTRAALALAADFLAQRCHGGSGWGFNGTVRIDCDSTAHASLFLFRYCGEGRYTALLHRFWCEDGGFVTYDQGLDDAWNRPQPDVTAAALCAMAQSEPNSPAITSAAHYLNQWQGLVPSYWWDDPCYATLKKLDGYVAAGIVIDRQAIERELANMALPDKPFALALFLELLCKVDAPVTRIQQAAWALLGMERNGCFEKCPILRVPQRVPGDTPTQVVAEQTGVFTAATALHALTVCRVLLEQRGYERT